MTNFARVLAVALAFVPFMLPSSKAEGSEPVKLKWSRSYAAAVRKAKKQNKNVLVQVGASWCGACRQLYAQTYTDQNLITELNENFLVVKLDADRHSGLVRKFGPGAYPTAYVVTPRLKIVRRITGVHSAAGLIEILKPYRPKDEPMRMTSS